MGPAQENGERPHPTIASGNGNAQQVTPSTTLDGEIRAEQASLDRAYERLALMRQSALDVVRHHQQLGQLNSSQARVEWESLLALTDQRLQHLELGGASLCFGRLDRVGGESFQIGRLSILDEAGDPLVVDWRAPAAEAFYQATGRNPMNLVRRRHLLTKGRIVVGIDDELFDLAEADESHLEILGEGALLATLERSRTGRMTDIVATIQAEQDQIIRAPLPGVLIVQGGPGTGKTAVALHRAAYLLYANRERLEDSGVLVVGPNRTFLRYIEHVLPSLGESGVELQTVDQLYGRARPAALDPPLAERTKGDPRMAAVIAKAVRDRQRPLSTALEVPYGSVVIRLPKAELERVVMQTRQRSGTHNGRRGIFLKRLNRALWRAYRRLLDRRGEAARLAAAELPDDLAGDVVALFGSGRELSELRLEREEEQFFSSIGSVKEVRMAADRMWPLLTPEQLLHDLFGAPSLLRLATKGRLRDDERDSLARARSSQVEAVRWTSADLALLDEAATLLGPLPQRARRRSALRDGAKWAIEETVEDVTLNTGELDPQLRQAIIDRLTDREEGFLAGEYDDGEPRVFGHLIVDEAQDVSPMQWRMIGRRIPGGSMTIVGDLGQASRAGAVAAWQNVLDQLPVRREPRLLELTVNYRTPSEIMEVAAAVLASTDPGLEPPRSVRQGGMPPRFSSLPANADMAAAVADQVAALHAELGEGKVAVVAPLAQLARLRQALSRLDLELGEGADALDATVALLTATEAKGLEFDAVVLVEPTEIAGNERGGMRGLYVALTRATKLLSVLHSSELPTPLVGFSATVR